jgi:hypothetical protein
LVPQKRAGSSPDLSKITLRKLLNALLPKVKKRSVAVFVVRSTEIPKPIEDPR